VLLPITVMTPEGARPLAPVDPGSRVTLVASWSADSAESYPVVDLPATRSVRKRRPCA
jgi:hypothetical protein